MGDNKERRGSGLTKNGCEALAACHRATLPSPSHAPNLFPWEVKRTRFTLAKTPGGRTFCTGCEWLHSHMRIEPSWHPVTSEGGWVGIHFIQK